MKKSQFIASVIPTVAVTGVQAADENPGQGQDHELYLDINL